MYYGGMEIGFELFRKYVHHVDIGLTKWDKIKLNETVNLYYYKGRLKIVGVRGFTKKKKN